MAILTTQLELFKILKQKLGEQESEVLVKFIQENTEDEIGRQKHDLLKSKDFKWIFGMFFGFMFALSIFFYNNLDKRMDRLEQKVETQYKDLNTRMDNQYQELNAKMDNQYQELNAKMDRQFELLNQRIDQILILIQTKK